MITKDAQRERINREIMEFIQAYAANFDPAVTCELLTPYCIRVKRRIRWTGRIRDVETGECQQGMVFTGASIGILDIYPGKMRYHALIPNVRGDIWMPWRSGIKKLIKTYML